MSSTSEVETVRISDDSTKEGSASADSGADNIVVMKEIKKKPLPSIPTQLSYPPYQIGVPVIQGTINANKTEVQLDPSWKHMHNVSSPPKAHTVKINKSKHGDYMPDAVYDMYLKKLAELEKEKENRKKKKKRFCSKKMKKITSNRIRVISVYVEVILIILICSLYAVWSAEWDNTQKYVIQCAFNVADEGGMIIGICAWIVFYIGFVIVNIATRCRYKKRTYGDVIRYILLTTIHVAYYLFRWPIFINMSTNACNNSNEVMASISVFLDLIIDLLLLAVIVAGVVTLHYCT